MNLQVAPKIEIIEEQEEETELEPLYRVIIHNDDVTPMDFVVQILKTIFYLSNPKAAEIMLTAHYYGTAYVQTLPEYIQKRALEGPGILPEAHRTRRPRHRSCRTLVLHIG